MKLGDSRSLEGTIVPAQDHRQGIDVDLRASEICVRIMDRDDEGRDRDEPELRGNRRGISVWEGQDDRIPCPQWREVRICAVVGPDGYTGSGLGDGTDEPGAAWTPSEAEAAAERTSSARVSRRSPATPARVSRSCRRTGGPGR